MAQRRVSRSDLQQRLGTCTAVTQWSFIIGASIVCLLCFAYVGVASAAYYRASQTPGGHHARWSSGTSIGLALVGVAVSLLSAASAFLLKRPLLVLTAVVLTVALVAQVFITSSTASHLSGIEESASQRWSHLRNVTIQRIQNRSKCCGFHGPHDRPGLPCPTILKASVGFGIVLSLIEALGALSTALLYLRVAQAHRELAARRNAGVEGEDLITIAPGPLNDL
eukprot:m51a1_g14472 hypothetical protein (224) ;mRNA; r:684237-685282